MTAACGFRGDCRGSDAGARQISGCCQGNLVCLGPRERISGSACDFSLRPGGPPLWDTRGIHRETRQNPARAPVGHRARSPPRVGTWPTGTARSSAPTAWPRASARRSPSAAPEGRRGSNETSPCCSSTDRSAQSPRSHRRAKTTRPRPSLPVDPCAGLSVRGGPGAEPGGRRGAAGQGVVLDPRRLWET